MGKKRPQPTAVLVKRLRRVAHWLDQMAEQDGLNVYARAQRKARANTCLQAAGRLEILIDPDAEKCEGCSSVATQRDNVGVPLCDDCFDGLDSSV
jgi:hypothetical protein